MSELSPKRLNGGKESTDAKLYPILQSSTDSQVQWNRGKTAEMVCKHLFVRGTLIIIERSIYVDDRVRIGPLIRCLTSCLHSHKIEIARGHQLDVVRQISLDFLTLTDPIASI